MESVEQTIDLLAGSRCKLGPFGTVMDPAMRGIAHAGPMAQYSSGSGRTIYNIDISPNVPGTVDISSAQKIVRKVPLHIFTGGSPDGQVRADPIANSYWERV
jgi:hypothetical protein